MSAGHRVRTAVRTLFGSTGAAVDQLTSADTMIRSVVPISRRIGFVSVAGGSGSTTAMTSVARVLAARRPGSILAVDAAGRRSGVNRRFGIDADSSADTEDDRDRRRVAQTAADASAGLVEAVPGLQFLDLNPSTDWLRPVPTVTEWAEQLGPIARFFDLVLTDWGVRPAADDLDQAAVSGQVLAVVSRADRTAATAAAQAVAALQATELAPRLLLVLADVGRTPDRIARGLRTELGVPVCWLPYDRAYGSVRPDSRRLAAATRRAAVNLAATVMNQAVLSQAPGRLAMPRPTGTPDPRRAISPGAGVSSP